jgi:serine O-acetyltransferase
MPGRLLPPRGLLALGKRLAADALELARVASAVSYEALAPVSRDPSARDVVKQVVTNDSFQILALTRLREEARKWHVPLANHLLRRVQTAVYGIEIGNEAKIGEGAYFVHPVGIVIGGDSRVGNRVKFMGGNTLGTAKENGYPIVEDDVVVGCGARILGPIRVGKGATIGANAVVIHDVPAGATVTGIPARVRDSRESRERREGRAAD